MTDWMSLQSELDRWAEAGRLATLWWRDDDAVAPHLNLDRLLAMTGNAAVPLALAVIPAQAEPALAVQLAGTGHVAVLQHGFSHENHAAPGTKKAEFAAGRPLPAMIDELARGRTLLRDQFGPLCRPVFVPPWNRILPALLPRLPRLGLQGLSAYAPRPSVWAAPGLAQANCHVDPVNWRAGGTFAGAPAVLACLVGHLQARRTGTVDGTEPTGLLTHHRQHQDEIWGFLGELLDRLRHPALRWLDIDAVFGAGPAVA